MSTGTESSPLPTPEVVTTITGSERYESWNNQAALNSSLRGGVRGNRTNRTNGKRRKTTGGRSRKSGARNSILMKPKRAKHTYKNTGKRTHRLRWKLHGGTTVVPFSDPNNVKLAELILAGRADASFDGGGKRQNRRNRRRTRKR